ncbi:hypothetical protein JCM5353_007379, partial [Sporobolomyces roseus]
MSSSLSNDSSRSPQSESISVSPELVPLPSSPSPSTHSSPARFAQSTPSSSRQSPLGPTQSRSAPRSPEDARRVCELSATEQASRSVSAASSPSASTRLDPSSTSALRNDPSPRHDREKSPSKWFDRTSTSSSSSSSTPNQEPTSPPNKTRSRSHSKGSLNLLTTALSPKGSPLSSSSHRPITPPSPTRPSTHSHGIVSSPDPLPYESQPRSSPPIQQRPLLQETRRGSATSTNSSHSSALLHFATSLKPIHPPARRKQSGESRGGEVLEEWADAGLEEGDEEGRAISEEMVRVTTSRS